jgi:hypothetical protein
MAKQKEIQTTTITYADYISRYEGDFPSKYVFRNGFGDYTFIHTTKKAIAEQWLVENYGKGVYSLREV